MGGLAPPAPKSELPWARTLGYLETTSVTKALPRETIERLVPGLSGYGEVPKAPGPAPT